jgi:hypothetical protein
MEDGCGNHGKEERCVQWYLLVPVSEEVVLQFSEEAGVQVGITCAT